MKEQLSPKEVHWWHKAGRSCLYPRDLCSPSEGPEQGREMGREEPFEIHQRQIKVGFCTWGIITPGKRGPRDWSQALLSSARQYDKRQWAEKDAQEIPSEQKEELYCAGNWTLEQIAQRGCTAPLTGDIKESSGCYPVPCALGSSCLNREVGLENQFCDSINDIPIPDATIWKTILKLYLTTPAIQKLYTGASNMNTYEFLKTN